jgi:hypothetical protein
LKDGIITIIDFKLCNVWEIINYKGKYPISLQCKKGMWYNIRPCGFNDMNAVDKTPIIFIKKIVEAINNTPNKLEDKTRTINNIYNQFYKLQFSKVIQVLK